MSLTGATKRRTSFHAAGSSTLGNDHNDLSESEADSPDLPAAKPCCSHNSRASSRAPKRIKGCQDPTTPTASVARSQKYIDLSKKYLRSTMRVPLGPTQGPGLMTQTNHEQAHDISKTDGTCASSKENDQPPQKGSFDEEFYGTGDIFTGTDQLSAQPSPVSRYECDESTTDC